MSLTFERSFLPSSRFVFEALVGLVARRGTGFTEASLDEFDQPLARLGAVAFLRAGILRDQHQHAVLGQPLAGQAHQADGDIVRQRERAAHIKTQLRLSTAC